MIRVLMFLIAVFALGIGFAWLADRPGDLAVTFNGYEYQISLMVAAVILVAVLASVMIIWWLLKTIWNSPRMLGRYFRARRRDRGYQALSTGLIAAGAGDSGLAKRMAKQASNLLSSDQEPLLHLLTAQTMLLEGQHDEARSRFAAMAEDPETRLLGLRGLYLEAKRLGEHEAARHYAEEAAAAAPQLVWAANATIGAKVIEKDFDSALKLVAGQASTKQLNRDEASRQRAVLLTAKAMELIDQDTAAARAAALEAHKLQPGFIPAAAIAGRVLFRQNELRKGSRILEAAWKKQPHPEIADIYVHARAGDSTHDRLKRAKKLQSFRGDNVESLLAVARAAFEAGEYRLARKSIDDALKMEARESAYLLLADIEEAETGDQGRVRHWLAKAVRAPRDPVWTADGYVSESWKPVSPLTGAVGTFEWRVPVERLGKIIEAGTNDEEIAILPIEKEPEPDRETPVVEIDAPAKAGPAGHLAGVKTTPKEPPAAEKKEKPEPPAVEKKKKPEPPDAVQAVKTERKGNGSARPNVSASDAALAAQSGAGKTLPPDEPMALEKSPPRLPSQAPASPPRVEPAKKTGLKPLPSKVKTAPDEAAASSADGRGILEEEDSGSKPRMPDDPGVEEREEADSAPGRFRLF